MGRIIRRSTDQKITIFRSLFFGRKDVYGTYDRKTGRASQVKAPLTNHVILAHLTGKQPFGVYLLVKDRICAVAVDFDTQDRIGPSEFVNRANHFGISAYIERSKSKGFHVWLFFDRRMVPAFKARRVVQFILEEIEQPQTEIFPKQNQLSIDKQFGNFINAPLFGPLVPKGRTAFVDPRTFHPYLNQWDFLESVEKIGEQVLDDVIETNDLRVEEFQQPITHSLKTRSSGTFGLPPCAIRIFREGVTQFQRVVCFRLAVHLKRLGLPYDVAVVSLKTWALKNRPINGKGVIRESEILAQTAYAYDHTYSGYGCNSAAINIYCTTSCPVKNQNRHNTAQSSEKNHLNEREM